MEKLKIYKHGRKKVTQLAVYQPGNGTRYEAWVMSHPTGPLVSTYMYVVAFPGWGACIGVNPGMHLALGYLGEKLRQRGKPFGLADLSEMGKLITMLVPDTTSEVCTDDRGFEIHKA